MYVHIYACTSVLQNVVRSIYRWRWEFLTIANHAQVPLGVVFVNTLVVSLCVRTGSATGFWFERLRDIDWCDQMALDVVLYHLDSGISPDELVESLVVQGGSVSRKERQIVKFAFLGEIFADPLLVLGECVAVMEMNNVIAFNNVAVDSFVRSLADPFDPGRCSCLEGASRREKGE